jgi:nitroreductase
MTGSPLAVDSRERVRASGVSFRPRLFCRALEADRQAMDALLSDGSVLFVHDTLPAQIEELLETRAPDRRIARSELAAQGALHAGQVPKDYGTWAYYAWSGRLVHVLPQSEYEELRTSRNRNKITRREQTELAKLRVGVAGLSVGQATAVTLALEGVGGVFRLADFDTLSLSNMNRLRESVHSLGVNKAVLAAREIAEINPYAGVEVFARGIDEDSIEPFLTSGGPLDLLFEECDDLKIKIRLRQEARKRGIAVMMETSDRGLLDIERFDREPERPLFHGLIPAIDPAEVAGLTAAEKIPIVLGIVGRDTMSPRLAASLVDVDATLKTWPQLASAVALGGAINTDAARRIALGKLVTSGRFFVDLEEIIRDAPASPGDAATASAAAASPVPPPPAPEDAGGTGADAGGLEGASQRLELGPDEPVSGSSLARLIELGTRAPSGGNVQPWRFTYAAGGTLRVWHDEVRSRSFLDFEARASHFAFGALAETLRLAAGRLGIGLSPLRAYPDPAVPDLVCEAGVGGAPERLSAEDQRFAACIEERVTTRRVTPRDAIAPSDRGALESTARGSGAELCVLADPEALAVLGEILGSGDRLRLLSPIMHREMMGEIRWSKEHANATRDGLDLGTLGLRPSDEAALRVVANPAVTRALREVGGGQGLARSAREAIAGAGAVGLVRVPARPRESGAAPARRAYFTGGIAATRVWLHATSLGIALQPMTALLYLFARLDEGGAGLDPTARTELEELRERYHSLFLPAPGACDVLLFRMTRADPATPRSLRRTVAQVLTVGR